MSIVAPHPDSDERTIILAGERVQAETVQAAPEPYQAPVGSPLLAPTTSGTTITVDRLTRPVTVIPEIVAELVAGNQGYFADRIFRSLGMTVQGGAILYSEHHPEDIFLPADQGPAPRAPGSEAPRIGIGRRGQLVSRVESWSGSLEVHDELRRRNDVITVTNAMTRLANTLADRMQTRAIQTLNAFVDGSGRVINGIDWSAALPNGAVYTDPYTLPARDFGLVMNTFANDKAGVVPDLVILNPDDAFLLDVIYADKLPALLDRYKLTMLSSPLQPRGEALFVKGGQVGAIAYEKPLDTELTREGTRKTDVFTTEATPVFVANDATAVLRVEGINP